MANITLRVNGRAHTVDVEPSTPLLYVLRNDLDLQGPRFGCGLGQCGACTVIINGEAMRSCVTPASSVKGEITTLEGLAKDGKLHPLQQAWIDEQVPQCGFCQNGQIMTAKALLDKNPNPTDAQIREGMARHAVPLHDVLPHSGRHQARREGGSHDVATIRVEASAIADRRRDFLKTSGMLVVGVSAAGDRRAVRRAAARRRARSLSRSRLPAARFVDRDPPGQHRHVLRRQDGSAARAPARRSAR